MQKWMIFGVLSAVACGAEPMGSSRVAVTSEEVDADPAACQPAGPGAPVNFDIEITINEGRPIHTGENFTIEYSTTPYPVTGTFQDNSPVPPETYVDWAQLVIRDLTTGEIVFTRDFGDRASYNGLRPCYNFAISVQRIGNTLTANDSYPVGHVFEVQRFSQGRVRHFDNAGQQTSDELLGLGMGHSSFIVLAADQQPSRAP